MLIFLKNKLKNIRQYHQSPINGDGFNAFFEKHKKKYVKNSEIINNFLTEKKKNLNYKPTVTDREEFISAIVFNIKYNQSVKKKDIEKHPDFL